MGAIREGGGGCVGVCVCVWRGQQGILYEFKMGLHIIEVQ